MRADKHFTGLRPKIDGEMERRRIGAMQQWTWNKIPQIPKFLRRNAAADSLANISYGSSKKPIGVPNPARLEPCFGARVCTHRERR